MLEIKDAVAVITGGSGGIGITLAKYWVAQGGKVLLADVAEEALAKAKDKTSGKVQMVVLDAYLKCADQLVAQGKKPQALAIYKELQKQEMPKPIRTAALRGMISVTKK